MITVVPTTEPRRLLRHSNRDALLVALAVAHGVLILFLPWAPVIAIGVWWNSNTISHCFLHKPFFRSRTFNLLFSIYLSVLLGVPQSIWRSRHLAHHAGVAWRLRMTPLTVIEVAIVLGLWGLLATLNPYLFAVHYLPGYIVGLVLCAVHGHFEHVRGTISHYGRPYNLLFFNDGYHVEHHANPGKPWSELPDHKEPAAEISRYPAVLRWLELLSLESLERLVLRSRLLQRFVLTTHERAFRKLLPLLPEVRSVGIVGGGIFPRTALILRRILPQARLVLIDLDAENLQTARRYLHEDVEVLNSFYDPARHSEFDLIVIPLAYIGDRPALYRCPPAPAIFVHDWIWRRRGASTVISFGLLKRLNLLRQRSETEQNLTEPLIRLCRY